MNSVATAANASPATARDTPSASPRVITPSSTAVATVFMARLAVRQIGGHTGDVLGATEQLVETAVLLVAAAQVQP